MVAVMIDDEKRPRGRPRQTYEQNVVTSELKYWGYHKGKQYAADGWPPESTLTQLLSGRGGTVGHKILVLEMPPEAWRINSIVMGLATDYIAALVSRYCLPVERETGRPYEQAFLAGLLDIDVPTYRARLSKAREAYAGLIFTPIKMHTSG